MRKNRFKNVEGKPYDYSWAILNKKGELQKNPDGTFLAFDTRKEAQERKSEERYGHGHGRIVKVKITSAK